MTFLYGGHAMSIVRRHWCDHKGYLCVMIFVVKVQLHQFGSDPQHPEDHDPSHWPIKYFVCSRLSLNYPKQRKREGHHAPRSLADRTAPSNFLTNFLRSLQNRVKRMLVCGLAVLESVDRIPVSRAADTRSPCVRCNTNFWVLAFIDSTCCWSRQSPI